MPDVPTFKEATGFDWAIGSWRGLAVPKGTPPEIVGKLQQAVGKVVENPEYVKFMKSKGYATGWTPGEGFRTFMAENDKSLGEMMRVVGIVK
jgi:tripartite-type tricarboxylate transporter receptor subunit TctC